MDEQIKKLIAAQADRFGVPREIVYGVCMKESGMDPFACRYEPKYRYLVRVEKVKPANCSLATETILQMTSFGLMQVMGGVFREYGLTGWLTRVIADPELQLSYGTRHLAGKIKRYGLEPGIAAYNAGVPDPDHDGDIDNPEYVKAVLDFSRQYKG